MHFLSHIETYMNGVVVVSAKMDHEMGQDESRWVMICKMNVT